MLTFVIRATAALLGVGAVLIVLGAFDAVLGWDIFGPTLEAVLYGLFFSSIGVAAIGVALCFVLGIHELVSLMRTAQLGEQVPAARPADFYWARAAGGITLLALLVVGLELANGRIQVHRREVFRNIAAEQIQQLAPKLAAALPASPPASTAKLDALMRTLENLDFVAQAALFVADPSDADALWRYEADWKQKGGRFERIFAAKRIEQAALRSLHGEPGAIAASNAEPSFTWLSLVGERAVLVLMGNETENFRLYSGGS